MNPRPIQFEDVPLSRGVTVADAINRISRATDVLVTFVNPQSYFTGRFQPQYLADLCEFELVLPDGIAMVAAARFLGLPVLSRISFDSTSLAPLFFDLCQRNSWPVFFVGGMGRTAEVASLSIRRRFPGLLVAGFLSGSFSIDEAVAKIKVTAPKVVICGMGQGLQERLLVRLRESGWTGVGVTCGGYMDQLSRGFHYYPALVHRLNLRFLYRAFREPKRVGRRLVAQYPEFLRAVWRSALTQRRRRES